MSQDPHFHQHTTEDSSLENMPSGAAFTLAADTFGLISDTSRLKILWLLCHHETCVNNIAVAVKMSSPAVSHHLRLLKQAGLVSSRRAGKEMYYKLAQTTEAALLHQALDAVLDIKCPCQ